MDVTTARQPPPAIDGATRISPPRAKATLRPDVAIVIATFNRDDMLRATIAEIAAQPTLPAACIIVDQGDPRDKQAILEPLLQRGVAASIHHSVYRSISAARNIGLVEATSASIILYLDDDVELQSDVIAEHARLYDNDPGVVAIAGHVVCEPLDEEFVRLNTFRPVGTVVRQGRGCHMSFRASVLREIGGFNAYICNNGDETELYRRLTKAGYAVHNGPRAVVKHLVCGQGGNRQVGLRSHANHGRVLRDGWVRAARDRGFWKSLLWPLKNGRILFGLCRSAPNLRAGLKAMVVESAWAIRLARLSNARQDYIPVSLDLARGVGVDPKTGLPTI